MKNNTLSTKTIVNDSVRIATAIYKNSTKNIKTTFVLKKEWFSKSEIKSENDNILSLARELVVEGELPKEKLEETYFKRYVSSNI